MKRPLLAILALAFALALPARSSRAVSTRSFVMERAKDFEAGTPRGAAIHSDGRLTFGLRAEGLPLTGVGVAYSSVLGADGALYVGTGDDGWIYRVRGKKAERFAHTGTALVASLVRKGSTLYAGTLPGGKIFAIDDQGKVRELCTLPDTEHVWALALDEARGTLYAGTGPAGRVFSVSLKGKVREVYDADAEHVLALALDGDALYAGVTDGAKVLRVRPGRAEVVADLDGDEVTALDARDGVIAAVANHFPAPPPVPDDPTKGGAARFKRPKPGSGKLYLIEAEGRARLLYEDQKTHFASVQLDGRGAAFLGTGQEGRVLRVARDTTHSVWADADERQVVRLGMDGSHPYFVTSDAAAVYRVGGQQAAAEWTSDVLDAGVKARWGELAPRAEGGFEWATRSGNTEEPDATWSAWSKAATGAAPVRSPAARFLQVRVRLKRDAQLYSLTAYYLPQNQGARVHDVGLAPAKGKGKSKDAPPAHAPPEPSTTYKLTWKVENPDGDPLRFRLFFRREDQKQWRPLLREHEELTKAEYAWDTRGIPDGFYRVRVEASDELANPAVYALKDEGISAPLRIDNHAPQVRKLRVQGKRLKGEAVDSLGPIAALSLSVDGGPFRPIFPRDDLLDTRRETFEADLSQLRPGTHILAVRATDAAGNVGSGELEAALGR